jgi:hypothetical protein
MARRRKNRKKKKEFGPAAEVRLRAREAIGTPPATRAVVSRKDKPPKHKKRLLEEELGDL